MQVEMFDATVDSGAVTRPDLGLYEYQENARAAVHEALQRSRGAVVVLPTGTGKSRLAGAVVWDRVAMGQASLILCPTIVLCRQMYRDMRALGLSCAVEQASNFAQRPLPAVTIASVDTMRGARLAGFREDSFGLVIADECHRSVSDAYAAIFERFPYAKRLGLTATPDRTDGVALGNVFDEVAYEMSMLDAIKRGWLVPLKFKTAETDFDPKALKKVAGDVAPESVAAELVRSGALHQAANTMAELAGDARAVAFLPTVASSKAFTAEINARHTRSANVAQYAAHIDGTTPEKVRNEHFAAFRDGVTRVLSNVGVLTEGWDAPHASVIALLNPTQSRSRICQMIGRGTRLWEGKEYALIIDFCPGRMKSGRLASPADALAGKMLPDRVAELIANEGDLAEAIEAATEAVEREKVEAEKLEAMKLANIESAKARERSRLRLRDEVRKRAFVYGLESHDMVDLLRGYGDPTVRLADAGVDVPQVESARRAQGLCTLKQAAVLARAKLNPNLPYRVAMVAIDAIASNDWVCPDHIRNDPRYRV